VAPATGDVSAIAVGGDHTCALTTGGGVKCWGLAAVGELGNGVSTGLSRTPVDVTGLASGVTAIAAGLYFTCALTSGGGVKCWGKNQHGQLGDGSKTNRSLPSDVVGLTSGVSAISAAYDHACALMSRGGVKCWGLTSGLGNYVAADRLTPVDAVGLTSKVSAIALSNAGGCALMTSGGVKCWGHGVYGELGNGSTTGVYRTPVAVVGLRNGVAAIDAGDDVCVLTDAGGAECWGPNQFGQLGNGSKAISSSTPVDVVGLTSPITALAVGFDHTCAITVEGGIKCWGHNVQGELGNGSTTDSSAPVDVVGLTSGVATISADGYVTCAIVSAGGVKCWGDNGYGQLGDGTTKDRSAPVDVSGL
jgi:alpha-tubulin suppressor-like RCC1 family protein